MTDERPQKDAMDVLQAFVDDYNARAHPAIEGSHSRSSQCAPILISSVLRAKCSGVKVQPTRLSTRRGGAQHVGRGDSFS